MNVRSRKFWTTMDFFLLWLLRGSLFSLVPVQRKISKMVFFSELEYLFLDLSQLYYWRTNALMHMFIWKHNVYKQIGHSIIFVKWKCLRSGMGKEKRLALRSVYERSIQSRSNLSADNLYSTKNCIFNFDSYWILAYWCNLIVCQEFEIDLHKTFHHYSFHNIIKIIMPCWVHIKMWCN